MQAVNLIYKLKRMMEQIKIKVKNSTFIKIFICIYFPCHLIFNLNVLSTVCLDSCFRSGVPAQVTDQSDVVGRVGHTGQSLVGGHLLVAWQGNHLLHLHTNAQIVFISGDCGGSRSANKVIQCCTCMLSGCMKM